jgi:polyribonucleotide nucleotidyltransferase
MQAWAGSLAKKKRPLKELAPKSVQALCAKAAGKDMENALLTAGKEDRNAAVKDVQRTVEQEVLQILLAKGKDEIGSNKPEAVLKKEVCTKEF